MKPKFTLLKIAFFILFSALSATAFGQATPFNIPSNTTTAPPTSATDVDKVLCFGGTINLKGRDPVVATNKYQWFKTNTSGVKVLVKEAVGNDTYSEPTNGAGYYTYELVVSNANDCSSIPSDPVRLYVLPDFTPVIAGGGTVCEKGQTTSDLTITGLDLTKYKYTYQWSRNGQAISAADGGTADHYVVKETTAGTATYTVAVAYELNAGCNKTSTAKTITVIQVPGKPGITIN